MIMMSATARNMTERPIKRFRSAIAIATNQNPNQNSESPAEKIEKNGIQIFK